MSELVHLDDEARPCTVHGPAPAAAILHLAAIGARMSGFNHDIASKLQGLMMSLEEITELAGPDSEVARSAELANAAVQELSKLLVVNRLLAKPPVASRIGLRELTTRASAQFGITLRGTLPEATLELAVPLVTHGLALAMDAIAGAGRSRSLEVAVRLLAAEGPERARAELTFVASAPSLASAPELLAIASWVVAREGGTVRCSASRLVVQLPVVS